MTMKRHLNEIKWDLSKNISRKSKSELIDYLNTIIQELTTPLTAESDFRLHFDNLRLENILKCYLRWRLQIDNFSEPISLKFISDNVRRSVLVEVRNCGTRSVKQLEEKLCEFGLTLKP